MSESTTRSRTRGDLLAELADTVNGLVEVRTHSEPYEAREGSKRVQRRHVETFPSLVDSLLEAMQPASSGDASSAGFESRPAAELEPIAVLADIETGAARYLSRAGLKPKRLLPATLRSLVGAQFTDQQLANLCRDARTWLHRAKIATGWETANFTIDRACPYCQKRNVLTVTGDMQRVMCRGCSMYWDHELIGLLTSMLEANEQPTLSAERCWMPECTAYGPHIEHHDHRGRTWTDQCDLPA